MYAYLRSPDGTVANIINGRNRILCLFLWLHVLTTYRQVALNFYAKNKMNIIHLKRMEFSKIKDILKSSCREIINPIANI